MSLIITGSKSLSKSRSVVAFHRNRVYCMPKFSVSRKLSNEPAVQHLPWPVCAPISKYHHQKQEQPTVNLCRSWWKIPSYCGKNTIRGDHLFQWRGNRGKTLIKGAPYTSLSGWPVGKVFHSLSVSLSTSLLPSLFLSPSWHLHLPFPFCHSVSLLLFLFWLKLFGVFF